MQPWLDIVRARAISAKGFVINGWVRSDTFLQQGPWEIVTDASERYLIQPGYGSLYRVTVR